MESIEFNAQIEIRTACFKRAEISFLKFSCNVKHWQCAHLSNKGKGTTEV